MLQKKWDFEKGMANPSDGVTVLNDVLTVYIITIFVSEQLSISVANLCHESAVTNFVPLHYSRNKKSNFIQFVKEWAPWLH